MSLAEAYLNACLDHQPGGELGFDLPGHRVVVQVTYGADQVLPDHQAQLEDPSTIAVELVRYSVVQLQRWADQIVDLPDDGRHMRRGMGQREPQGWRRCDRRRRRGLAA